MKTKTINSIQDHNAFQIEKIEALGDPLVNLKKNIDWEGFRPKLTAIHSKERKSNAGATAFDVVFMLQILILQQLNNLADEKTEFMIRDRLTYQRFLSIKCGDRIPDAKTIWGFSNTMMALGLYVPLFDEFNQQLAELGYSAKQGQLIDATFIEAPRQRNTREENAQIKACETPEAWKAKGKEPMLRQKDIDATWTKKNNENLTVIKIISTLINNISSFNPTKYLRLPFMIARYLKYYLIKHSTSRVISDLFLRTAPTARLLAKLCWKRKKFPARFTKDSTKANH